MFSRQLEVTWELPQAILSISGAPLYCLKCYFTPPRTDEDISLAYFTPSEDSQGKGILLLRCGDVELNPGPFSVGQDPRLEKRDPKTKKTLRLVHLNARSIVRHSDDIVCLVSSTCREILALSETWLDSSVGDGELYLPGYTFVLLSSFSFWWWCC